MLRPADPWGAADLAAAEAYRLYREGVQRGDDQESNMRRLRRWLELDNAREGV